MAKSRRRQAGEGSISEYATNAGPRFLIKYWAPQSDGTRKQVLRRGFHTRKAAAEALREQLANIDRGTHVAPSRMTVEQHFATWLDGLRKGPTTVASYRKNVRLHVVPHIGDVKLAALTGARLNALYRQLETSGRHDGAGGLGARTVRYIHTIIHSALAAAIDDSLIAVNPASKAKPPTAKQAKSPEMRTWDAGQLRTFLDWSERERPELYPAWLLLAMTGMRRGEALAVRWGDVDFEAGTLAVRRSAVLVKAKGEGQQLDVGPPKSGRSRVVDLDPRTLAALRAHRAQRGALSLSLARDDAYVLGRLDGGLRHPERLSREFGRQLASAARQLGDAMPPVIRLHDLRHTHATLYLRAGVHPKIVSERLGHATISITLDVYSHAMPTMQREAATQVAALIYGGTPS
ncbi:tyrosine-type recombinase/integrase [Blastococcus deserti]|uniref:Tyrosine-type recombinase/integrase n=1 Tax=Blastococcus deserti TaxID=2259033 RepID=A0ABW4XGI5_9ACTN